jgi:1,4-alpha-glucan branching enzyme
MGWVAAGFSAAVFLWVTFFQSPVLPLCENRFVLFEPAAEQVELTGSFTGWQRISMQRIGHSGYWELNLEVPSGEHRFAYILDGRRRIADPTLLTREKDDFGGENSILSMEEST